VEAGLRSFMMMMPEEQNRILTDRLSTWLFCPTISAVDNLQHEGIPVRIPASPSSDEKDVAMVGDVMLDASLYYRATNAPHRAEFMSRLPRDYYLLTIHRAENTDNPIRLNSIVSAINVRSDLEAIFPAHPRTRKTLERLGISFGSHVHFVDPVGYFDMLALEANCQFVITDSGGVQKEAYFFKKPCMTLRDSTEWVELVESGWNRLVGANEKAIVTAFDAMKAPSQSGFDLYGNGHAGEAIIDRLLKYL
jgi:UDP-GlcNAc3NAcA epimerase